MVASVSHRDLPTELAAGVQVVAFCADQAAAPVGRWNDSIVVRGGDFFTAGRLGRERFDGILLAMVPADHPQAWRHYNARTMRQQLGRLQDGGLAALRLRSGDAGLGVALAAAKTFHEVVGPSRLVAEHHDGRIDLLIVGPAERLRQWNLPDDLLAVASGQIWYEWPSIRALRLVSPQSSFASGPSVRQFVSRLQGLRRP